MSDPENSRRLKTEGGKPQLRRSPDLNGVRSVLNTHIGDNARYSNVSDNIRYSNAGDNIRYSNINHDHTHSQLHGTRSYVENVHNHSHVGGNRSYAVEGRHSNTEYITPGQTRTSLRRSNSPRTSMGARRSYVGENRIVSEHAHPERSRVVNVHEGQGVVVDEHVIESRVIREYENIGEGVVVSRGNIPKRQTNTVREINHEVPRVVERIIEKQIEVVKENPVARQHYVDKQYDVIIEKPIERVIEKEVVTEKIVEIPMRRVVEIPIDKIVEVPYERIIEEPVEHKRYIDKITERVVQKPVERIYENVIYEDRIQQIDAEQMCHFNHGECLPEIVNTIHEEHLVERPVYRDNIINKMIEVPVEKLVEVEKERVIEVPVENIVEHRYQVENIIEKKVNFPVEYITRRQVEQVHEVPEYIDNPIANPVPVEFVTEELITVPVPNYVDKPVYIPNVVEHLHENIITNMVPVPQVTEIPIENINENRCDIIEFQENLVEMVIEKPVGIEKVIHAPVEYLIEKTIEVPVQNCVEHNLDKYHPVWEEEVIQKTVNHEKVTEVETLIEKPVNILIETIVEEPEIEEIVEERVVYVEQIIERKVTRIVEKEVIVPVERIVNVPVHVITERFVPVPKYIEQEVVYERNVEVPVQGAAHDDVIEVKDESLEHDIMVNQKLIGDLRAENARLAGEWDQHSIHLTSFTDQSKVDRLQQERINLNSHLSYLQGKLNCIEQDTQRLSAKATMEALGDAFGLRRVILENPNTEGMRTQLRNMIRENQILVNSVRTRAVGPTVVGNGIQRPGQNPTPYISTDPRDLAERDRQKNILKNQATNQNCGQNHQSFGQIGGNYAGLGAVANLVGRGPASHSYVSTSNAGHIGSRH